MKTVNVLSILFSSPSKLLVVFLSTIASLNVAHAMDCTSQALKAKALEKLSIPGTKISLSHPTPIYEKPYDSKSNVIGYALRYYLELGSDYGIIGELDFFKTGDLCSSAAVKTFETVTPVAIPPET